MALVGLFRPASSRALWWITFVLIAGYFVGIWILAAIGFLDQKDYVQSLSAFIGWIVTLILAVLHFRQTQNENENTRREEVKKRLQIEAFQKINESITRCSEMITKVTTSYRTIPVSLSVWRTHNPSLITSELERFRTIISEHHIMLWDAVTPFILTVEAHEVTVIEYDHLRKFIQFRIDDAQNAIKRFRMSIEKLGTAQITSEEGWANFEKERKAVERALFEVTMYLFDYRIELMNELLGDVFEKTVPRRTPVDPQFKTLIELATCEAVKEESERRDRLETSTT